MQAFFQCFRKKLKPKKKSKPEKTKAIYGYEKSNGGYRFIQFKEREELDETLKFWGTHQPKEV